MILLQRVRVLARNHGADAGERVGKRNEPEPALVEGRGQNASGLVAGHPARVLEIAEQRDVAEELRIDAAADMPVERARFSRRVDDEPRTGGAFAAGGIDEPHTRDAAIVEERVDHGVLLPYVDTAATRVVQQNLIEARALDLIGIPSAGLFEVALGAEREVPRLLAPAPPEHAAELRDEAGVLDLVQNAEHGADDVNGGRQERFPDPISGKRSFSSRSTRWPCSATRVEAVEPAGPPPMTMRSNVSGAAIGCWCRRSHLQRSFIETGRHLFMPMAAAGCTIPPRLLGAPPRE